MNKKNQWTVKMVTPQQIAKKKYRGCGTTQAVKNFCVRYRVNCFWWTPPTGGKKILMVDVENFRNYWKLVHGSNTANRSHNRNAGSKSKHASKRARSSWTTRTRSARTKYRRAA